MLLRALQAASLALYVALLAAGLFIGGFDSLLELDSVRFPLLVREQFSIWLLGAIPLFGMAIMVWLLVLNGRGGLTR